MQYFGIILATAVSYCFLSVALGGETEMKGSVEYSLSLASGPNLRGQAIPCRLLMHNAGATMMLVKRPTLQQIDLKAVGPGGIEYRATWQDTTEARPEADEVALKSGCELSTPIGSFILQDIKGKFSELPIGRYSISGDWKALNRGEATVSKIVGTQVVDMVEYPLRVKLDAAHGRYALGEPVQIQVSLENDGAVPVRLLNYFYPLANHFAILLNRQTGEHGGQHAPDSTEIPPRELAAITPDARTGWITLWPGENLRLVFEVTEFPKEQGLYSLQVAYQRPILLCAPGTKAQYTEQHRWESNVIGIDVVDKKK